MTPEDAPPVVLTGFYSRARRVLLRTKSTVHDSAKSDEALNLFLGELLLVCHPLYLASRLSDHC